MTGSEAVGSVFFGSLVAIYALVLRRAWGASAEELEETRFFEAAGPAATSRRVMALVLFSWATALSVVAVLSAVSFGWPRFLLLPAVRSREAYQAFVVRS